MSLIFGLLAVLGLLFVSLVGVTGTVWMGVVVGGIELAVAVGVTPPPGARSLRGIAALFGLLTLVWSVVRVLAS